MRSPAVRLVDLSVPLVSNPSEVAPVEFERFSHEAGGRHLAQLVNTPREGLPQGLAWASERVRALTHAGTHVDAPYHFSPSCASKPSRTIDEMPLDWFWGPAVCWKVEVRDDERPVSLEEVENLESQPGIDVEPGTLVFFRTGAEAAHGRSDYDRAGRPLEPALVEALLARGVRVIGTDSWSLDPSVGAMRRAVATAGSGAAWRVHYLGRDHEFCMVERLTRLAELPGSGFWAACFPIKVHRGSAGWTRAVAFVPESLS